MSERVARPKPGLIFGLVLAAGCAPRPPYAVVAIEDPSGRAASADELLVGFHLGSLQSAPLASVDFPLNLTVTAPETGEHTVWAEARVKASGQVLARGRAKVVFRRTGTPTATITLAQPCDADLNCDDGLYCTGVEACVDQECVAGERPCMADYACVTVSTCIELGGGAGTCDIAVDHTLCPEGQYCNPAVGCVQGQGCQTDLECQTLDGSVCNGLERCVNLVCVGGATPSFDDQDICTLDGCNDARASQGLDPAFHLALPALDGTACTEPGSGAAGVCVSAKGGCVESACGDAVVFTAAGEVCDDGALNTDSWSLTRHCNAACTGSAPYCGDGHVDTGHEDCDDGDALDSGNGCSDHCQRNDFCGDRRTQSLYEACDDGDLDNCNGCRSDCQLGCLCLAANACSGSRWCSDGLCVDCTTAEHCGPTCAACDGQTPVCAGAAEGCVCATEPAPNGSCLHGSKCAAQTCELCANAQSCGPSCEACGGTTPVCGGSDAGCVTLDCTGLGDFTHCQTLTSPDLDYDICLSGVCTTPGCPTTACSPTGPDYANADTDSGWQLPDSGQDRCADPGAWLALCPGTAGDPSCATTPFCGQDAQYGWDLSHTATDRWTLTEPVVGEGVVTDLLTGLMWSGCLAGLSGTSCNAGILASMSRSDALQFCQDRVWGGYTDWRLPDVAEALSIVSYDGNQPAIASEAFRGVPTIDSVWTSTFAASGLGGWTVTNKDGNPNTVPPSALHLARCVRSTPSLVPWSTAARFNRSTPGPAGERVVQDARTGLMWESCAGGLTGGACGGGAALTLTWEQALARCEGLSWAGFSDWRLPNVVELLSLGDPSRYGPAIDAVSFPATGGVAYWTSTTAQLGVQYASTVDFATGTPGPTGKTLTTPRARCVRLGL